MKIYIGPYTDRWVSHIHRTYMLKKYGFMYGDNKTRFEHFLEKTEDVLQIVYNKTINLYLDKKQRKIKIKLHKYDTWGMYSDLALIILPLLKALKEKKQGSPWVDNEDVPPELSSDKCPKNEHGGWDDNVHKRWEYVLNEMIWAFEQIVDSDSENKFFEGIYRLDVKGFDRKGYEEFNNRKQKGLTLFGKYYQGLWD